jgi:thioredoxin-like negative regulator of GroEL
MSIPGTVQCGACMPRAVSRRDQAHRRARCGQCRAPLGVEPAELRVVTDASFENDALRSPLPVLLDFWTPRALEPVIDALARAYVGRARVAKLNVDENPGVAARYAVQGIPTLVVFDGGHLRDRVVGAQPRAVLEARLDAALTRTLR